MAKYSQARWDKAKVLIEAGESITSAAKLSGVERSTLSKKAKSLGWIAGKNHAVIVDDARVTAEKSRLNAQELEHHNREVDKLIAAQKIDDYLDGAVGVAAKRAVELIKDEEATMQDIGAFGKFQLDARKGLGTLKEEVKTVINNTNDQQNTPPALTVNLS